MAETIRASFYTHTRACSTWPLHTKALKLVQYDCIDCTKRLSNGRLSERKASRTPHVNSGGGIGISISDENATDFPLNNSDVQYVCVAQFIS